MNSDKIKGITFIILAAAGFSLMSLFVRLSGDLPVFEKGFFRNFVAAVVSFGIIRKEKTSLSIPKGERLPMLLRCSFGTVGLLANFWAISNIALADANMLNKMSPVFAMIFSAIYLKEIPSFRDTACLALALVGAVFVVKPGTGLFHPAAAIGLFSGMCAGIAYTFVRRMGSRGVKGSLIVFCFSLFSCIASLILMIPDFVLPTLSQVVLLLLAGSFACLGQFAITAAYTFAPAKEINVFDFTQVLFAALWAFLLFRELPDVYSIAGYVLIIGTGIYRWHYALKTS